MQTEQLNPVLYSINYKSICSKVLYFTLLLGCLLYLSFVNFLLYHSLAEFFSIVIGMIIFVISINISSISKSNLFYFLGISYGIISMIDFIHTMAYKGMGIFPGDSADPATQLWIVARFVESISLLILSLCLGKKVKNNRLTFFVIGLSTLGLLMIFPLNIFPQCYMDGVGLTTFKVVSEYVICVILVIATIVLFKKRNELDSKIYSLMFTSFIVTILSELFFTLYIDVYDIFNVMGHFFKIVSFYLVYKSLVQHTIKAPYIELEKREKRYAQIFNAIPDGIAVIHNGRYLFANMGLSRILNIEDPKKIMGRYEGEFSYVHSDFQEQVFRRYQDLLIKKKPVPFLEQKIVTHDNRVLDVEIAAMPFGEGEDVPVLAIIRDISERKQFQEEKRRLREKIEIHRTKNELFSNVSHEFKTPVNIILGSIQLLKLYTKEDKLAQSTDKVKKHLSTMTQNSYRLIRLINNVVDSTRMDGGLVNFDFENHNIVNIVEEITLSVVDYARIKNISIVFDTELEECMLACDPYKIEKVMLNLLSNAIKFTGKRGNISVNIYDRGEEVAISVKDDGIGIPEDKIGLLFQRFMQVSESLKKRQEGSGIGLALTKFLVENHGGRVEVSSTYGEGSQFTVYLPVKTIEECQQNEGTNSYYDNIVERISIEFSDIYSSDLVS